MDYFLLVRLSWSEEHDEKEIFISWIPPRYKRNKSIHQGHLNVNMMVDNCWMLKRENLCQHLRKESTKRSLEGKRKCNLSRFVILFQLV